MRPIGLWASIFTAGAVLSVALPGVDAKADTSHLPAARQCGNVTFISGGIGTEESEALKKEAPKHNLALLFSVRIGTPAAYTTDVHVTILDSQDRPVLDVISDGPYFLTDLPAGQYVVAASSGMATKQQKITLRPGAHRLLGFEWTEANP